jgi:hypothetical protein
MRIWSIHPKYLDAKGLVALWRETLLAKHVLEGKTKGYTHHPQLIRFRAAPNPLAAINQYLSVVYQEAVARGYHFDASKIEPTSTPTRIPVSQGQVDYELHHLLRKLQVRDPQLYQTVADVRQCQAHPLFQVVAGGVEAWEKQ